MTMIPSRHHKISKYFNSTELSFCNKIANSLPPPNGKWTLIYSRGQLSFGLVTWYRVVYILYHSSLLLYAASPYTVYIHIYMHCMYVVLFHLLYFMLLTNFAGAVAAVAVDNIYSTTSLLVQILKLIDCANVRSFDCMHFIAVCVRGELVHHVWSLDAKTRKLLPSSYCQVVWASKWSRTF